MMMILILPSAALTVRFLTRRFIGEYGDMGECQARARPVPVRDWGQEASLLLPAGFHCFLSSSAFLQSLCLLLGGLDSCICSVTHLFAPEPLLWGAKGPGWQLVAQVCPD